jgi:hypothetical protein
VLFSRDPLQVLWAIVTPVTIDVMYLTTVSGSVESISDEASNETSYTFSFDSDFNTTVTLYCTPCLKTTHVTERPDISRVVNGIVWSERDRFHSTSVE